MIKNILIIPVANEMISRINCLEPGTTPVWGKMSADQMLAHCNVPYAYTFYPERFKRPGTIARFLLRIFVKNVVTGNRPYKKSSRTAPEFTSNGSRDFEKEKELLIENIKKCGELGASFFEGKENFSFGKMTAKEWKTLFYKHLDHHLTQFNV